MTVFEENVGDVCFRVLIFGCVQGVGFRYHTCEQAKQLGVRGWVCNRSDGSVEAYICGSKAQLDVMKAWLAHGPDWAQVNDIYFEEATAEGLSDFTMR